MHRLQQGSKVVGTKQTMKALKKGLVTELFVAEDAQKKQVGPLVELAMRCSTPVVYVTTMKELGKACDVEVKTATAALIESDW